MSEPTSQAASTVDHVEVRPGIYYDSVTLMLLSRTLLDDPAVDHAVVAMGTALNLELLTDANYDLPAVTAGDLVIAFRRRPSADEGSAGEGSAEAGAGAERILVLVDRLLSQSGRHRDGDGPSETPAHTLRAAIDAGQANVALISVPGEHAFAQAVDAIEAGAHPIIFSDNVSVDYEVALKRRAADNGLLAMGPDCGTVILDGVGLGFANVVTPGPIGLASASGTGAQQVCALCDLAGVGVRHVLGLGGRDLTDDVGGLSALPAIRLLDDDPAIEVIGVIAKRIDPITRTALDALTAEIATPVVIVPGDDLTTGTVALLAALGSELADIPTWQPSGDLAQPAARPGRLLGLFSGGTLAGEAARFVNDAGVEAEIIDLGDDEYTRGRPHPMIDNRLRLERLAAAADDDDVAAVLLDVVLGHGAAPDPAGELAPAIAAIGRPVFVSLVGTSSDPQGLERQAELLTEAGASVFASNAHAVAAAISALTTDAKFTKAATEKP